MGSRSQAFRAIAQCVDEGATRQIRTVLVAGKQTATVATIGGPDTIIRSERPQLDGFKMGNLPFPAFRLAFRLTWVYALRMARGGRRQKSGLRVAYHDSVEKLAAGGQVVRGRVGAGWYIEVRRIGKWFAIMDLRFARERDAFRAMASLTAAGLDADYKLRKSDPLLVKQVATEFLQW